jgi:tetratricopeptide (TPR) repeat protein
MDEPPGPHGIRTFDELVDRLRALRVWSGLGYHEVHRRVAERRRPDGLAYNTVYRCFQPGRSRLDVELVVDIARVLLGADGGGSAGHAEQWRAAHQVVAGLASEAEVVSVATALPEGVAGFTGRAAELTTLLDAATAGAAAVATIEGMAGVGKTQLAVQAGRQLVRHGRCTDLQLWVNLRGHDPERPPADPAAVLGAFLRRLGVPGEQVYHLDLAGRTACFRRLLAGRRVLVVLDNAAGEDQVRPLLPDTPTCFALVTSRRALTGLRAARRVRLDVFSADEAVELLRAAVGPRVDDDPATAAGIAGLVGHLPLALRLVAGRIARSPDWTLGDHLARLAERNRSGRLDDGVEIALHSSHDALRPPARRLLRLLALHPGDDIDAHAAAALDGSDPDTALAHLDELVSANLLRRNNDAADHAADHGAEHGVGRDGGRHEFHDVVRLYAAARAVDDEPGSARHDALTRLFDHYLHTAATAMATLYPVRPRRQVVIPPPPTTVPPVDDPVAARAWLESERVNLYAVVAHAAAHGRPSHATALATTIARHLDIGGHHGDALTVHGHALAAARAAGDRAAEATAHGYLGITHWRLDGYERSIEHTREAIALFRELGDRTSEALALANIGIVAEQAGRYEEAAGYARLLLRTARETGHREGEGTALNNLGLVLLRLGRHEQSVEHSLEALRIRREQGDRAGEALVLCNLGAAHRGLGRHDEAAEHYRLAVVIGRESGYRNVESHAMSRLGELDQRQGRLDRAVERHRAALALARELDDASLESEVRTNLGHALRALGHIPEALEHHGIAIDLARTAGLRLELAAALDGMAHAVSAAGRGHQARHYWQAALDLHLTLGTPDADEVRAHLVALDREPA